MPATAYEAEVRETTCAIGETTCAVGERTCAVGETTCAVGETTCAVGETRYDASRALCRQVPRPAGPGLWS